MIWIVWYGLRTMVGVREKCSTSLTAPVESEGNQGEASGVRNVRPGIGEGRAEQTETVVVVAAATNKRQTGARTLDRRG